MPVGIYMKSDGLMVIGTGPVKTKDGSSFDPAQGLLQSGDYIEAINGEPARKKEDMIEAVAKAQDSPIQLTVRRGEKQMDVTMTPLETENGDYKLGVWIRDDTQGIGTMTYVAESGEYGALGHGISDSDTGLLVDTCGGELYDTEIMGIEKDLWESQACCPASSTMAASQSSEPLTPTQNRAFSAQLEIRCGKKSELWLAQVRA